MNEACRTASHTARVAPGPFPQRRMVTGIYLLLIAYVVLGFWQSYFRNGMIRAPLPGLLVHVHAMLFVGWLGLFGVQLLLVRTRRVALHRTLGLAMGGWATAMVVSGIATSILAFRRAGSGVDAGVLAGNFVELAGFAVLLGLGFAKRRSPTDHRRLMTIASAILVAPAIIRWPFAVIQAGPPVLATLFYLLPPILLAVQDLATVRRVHRATLIGFALFVAVPVGFVAFPALPGWVELTDRLRDR